VRKKEEKFTPEIISVRPSVYMHDRAISSIAVRHFKVGDKVHNSVKTRCKAKADNGVINLQDAE
jgi:hypothetical protein